MRPMPIIDKAIEVIKPGVVCQIQDSGRFGFTQLGLTTGGAADPHAYYWANRLLNNEENAAVVEMVYGGAHVKFHIPTYISVTGAAVSVKINGQHKLTWASIKVNAGDTLELGMPREGVRCYLAVSGGIQVPEQANSRSTVVRENIGGVAGRALEQGDYLPASMAKYALQTQRLPMRYIPRYSTQLMLRVILGYQQADFCEQQKQTFFASEYRVSKYWDRMGYRLSGPEVHCQQQTILSEGIALGAIQIPADGQPIVLMQDRQTLGGYPKIGTVFSLDLAKLAQCGEGARVRFRPISLQQAQTEWLSERQQRGDITPLLMAD